MRTYHLSIRLGSGEPIYIIVDSDLDQDNAMSYLSRSLSRTEFIIFQRDPSMYNLEFEKSSVILRCSAVDEIILRSIDQGES